MKSNRILKIFIMGFSFFIFNTINVSADSKEYDIVCYMKNNNVNIGESKQFSFNIISSNTNYENKKQAKENLYNYIYRKGNGNIKLENGEDNQYIRYDSKTNRITGLKSGRTNLIVKYKNVTRKCGVYVLPKTGKSNFIEKLNKADEKLNDARKKSVNANLSAKVTSVTINNVWNEVKKGKSYAIQLKVKPSSITDYVARYKSSDPSIISVDKRTGVITANKVGTATITATVGNKRGTRKIKVRPASLIIDGQDKLCADSEGYTPATYSIEQKCTWSLAFTGRNNATLSNQKSALNKSNYKYISTVTVNPKKIGVTTLVAKCGKKKYRKTITIMSTSSYKNYINYIKQVQEESNKTIDDYNPHSSSSSSSSSSNNDYKPHSSSSSDSSSRNNLLAYQVVRKTFGNTNWVHYTDNVRSTVIPQGVVSTLRINTRENSCRVENSDGLMMSKIDERNYNIFAQNVGQYNVLIYCGNLKERALLEVRSSQKIIKPTEENFTLGKECEQKKVTFTNVYFNEVEPYYEINAEDREYVSVDFDKQPITKKSNKENSVHFRVCIRREGRTAKIGITDSSKKYKSALATIRTKY